MFFSKLKISTKLIISSAVFLIPITVMILFISSATVGMIKKSEAVHGGIFSLKPAVTIMQNLPEYLNVYLDLKQGDLSRLDEQISGAAKSLDNELWRYRTEEKKLPGFFEEWEKLKKIDKDNEELYQQYLDYTHTLRDLISWIGEHSRLILVADMNTYYYVSSAISSMPEASVRLITIGNLIRKNLHEAESVAERWNIELADAQSQGRRLAARPFDGDFRNITMNMLVSSELQLVRNSSLLFESDKDRISSSLKSAMDENKKTIGEFEELKKKLERYQDTVGVLAGNYGRISAFNTTNPCTAAEFLNTLSQLNTDLSVLWSDTFVYLDTRIQRNTSDARGRLVLYLAIVLVSLGFAFAFVVFITLDINRSVKTLKTLFKGLNENDLTMSLQINSRDEFGELMTAFNGFLDILRSTFGSFKQSAQLVANSVFDLSSSSKEITTTANEQSASVSEIVSTMESSKNLSEQIAFKTTEVADLAKETQELSSKGAELREANQNMMEDIRRQNQKIINEIRNLSDMIIRISEAIRIIDSIADQTKLIAFNASLEASSSGEAGARFSVVASEIRRFADNVAESTQEIKQKIEEVQGASQTLIAEANSGSKQIEIGYERMSEQKIVFEDIVDNSQNVATRSQQISNLSKQQELASSQIFSALKEISAGVKQFVIATSSTSKTAESLNGMSEELKGKVEKYRTET
ncbi:MAG: methyl-accepting chemotaxis protein [Treponema sp.]|nr:methyl-accepting chemotaxis protein [Treponema sp.]